MPNVNAGHFFVGTQGIALLRGWLSGDGAALARRVDEIRRALEGSPASPMSIQFDVSDLDVGPGYASWSATYDAGPNPLIRVEEPVVRSMIDRSSPGEALDAACGTGRHAAYLVERGHRVAGIDASPEMLAKARTRLPSIDLRLGDLRRLPVDDASVDLAVCALALTHLPDVDPAIAELARVLRPGGRLILSDLHPTMVLLGGTGFFFGDHGAGNVRTFHHPQARYLAAFRGAGLEVLDCAEPPLEEEDLAALSGGLARLAPEAFHAAWVGLPNAIVWELARPA
jgi:SAM-dependent methyltransferase